MAMRERIHQDSKYHRKVFNKCKIEDFTSRGIIIDEDSYESKIARFCPHIDMDLEPWYMVQNAYNDDHLRNSFSVEILTCKKGDCKGKVEIGAFLNDIYFTLYTIAEMVDFSADEIENRN